MCQKEKGGKDTIVQGAGQILYDVINLLKENSPRAGIVWEGQVDEDQELVQMEHSRQGEETGEDLEGGTGRVPEGHWSEFEVFKSLLETTGSPC